MAITSGSRLGPYEISLRLGAGGMGEVWRAKDTRLDRSVAIKILPAELAHNPQLKTRLEREAKAISQLNHPNICTLYDVGDGYLVMELLEGDTLGERVARGPLPLPDVLKYGVQIAEALDRAHRAGIIHRDLKPGNVMLTKSGAKLLDFGLARSEINAVVDTDGPTMQVRETLTEEGTVIGTFQYMAPEQLEAEPADARTDIFALGCVLYEMATGRRAFRGKTKTSLIAAIVSSQPQSIASLQAVTPTAFEHVVQKCLEKEPDDRWQSAHDVAEELKWIANELERGEVATRGKTRVHWAVAGLLAITTLSAAALWWRERMKPAGPIAFAIHAPRNATIMNFALSPDGRSIVMLLAYLGRTERDIAIRRLDEFEPKTIGKTKGERPQWSPDGRWILYWEEGNLLRIPSTGGKPETIARNVTYGVGAAWGADGTILFAPRFTEGLYRVPSTGGTPQRVTTLDAKRHETLHGWPRFLPDGQHFVFIVHTVGDEQNEIHVGSLDGTHHQLMRADALVAFARGSIVFVRDGAMYAQTFDTGKLALEDEPRRIAEGVAFQEDFAQAGASVSPDGAIAYVPVQPRRLTASWVDRGGRTVAPAFEETDIVGVSALSRDGTRLAFLKFNHAKGAADVYAMDFQRGVRTRVTGGLSNHNSVKWSPSNDRVYFSSDRAGMYDVYAQVDDGTAPAETLWQSPTDKTVGDVSSDGRFLLVDQYKAESRNDIWLLPTQPGAGAPRLLVGGESNESSARWSPDDKWMLYFSDRSGRQEVYVRRFPDGRSVQVSTEGAIGGGWSHDGSSITVVTTDRVLVSVPIHANGDVPVLGKPERLFHLDPAVDAIINNPTDERFLVTTVPDALDQISVVHYVRRKW